MAQRNVPNKSACGVCHWTCRCDLVESAYGANRIAAIKHRYRNVCLSAKTGTAFLPDNVGLNTPSGSSTCWDGCPGK
jgi:hypothetical protein